MAFKPSAGAMPVRGRVPAALERVADKQWKHFQRIAPLTRLALEAWPNCIGVESPIRSLFWVHSEASSAALRRERSRDERAVSIYTASIDVPGADAADSFFPKRA